MYRSNELYHYGVKGMKWRKRKAKKSGTNKKANAGDYIRTAKKMAKAMIKSKYGWMTSKSKKSVTLKQIKESSSTYKVTQKSKRLINKVYDTKLKDVRSASN